MTHPEKLEQGSGMIRLVDRQAGVSHRERMKARRERQRSRTAGFTAVKNNRITQAINTGTIILLAKNEKEREVNPSVKELTQDAARNLAVNAVRQTLPTTPIGVRTRRYV